jgi:hypothetical protein
MDTCFDCSPSGTFFHFDIALLADPLPPALIADWSVFAAPADVGSTFFMPQELVPRFHTILTHPDRIFVVPGLFGDGSHSFISPPKLNQTDPPGEVITVTRVAPNLGPNLFGYRVTSITQTIDELVYTNIASNRFRGTGSHTVRVYGEIIPEPASVLTMVIATLLCCGLRRIRYTRC